MSNSNAAAAAAAGDNTSDSGAIDVNGNSLLSDPLDMVIDKLLR